MPELRALASKYRTPLAAAASLAAGALLATALHPGAPSRPEPLSGEIPPPAVEADLAGDAEARELGWAWIAAEGGDVLRISYTLSNAPDQERHRSIPLKSVPAFGQITAWAERRVVGPRGERLAYVNRAIAGTRFGEAGRLYVGGLQPDPNGLTVLPPRRFRVIDLGDEVRPSVETVDAAARAAARGSHP